MSRSGVDRVLAGSVLAVLVLLAAVGDDRHVGLIADGRQMIRTAVAITETAEIGQARERDFTIARPAGDAVSRFGMATSLLQVPAAWLAPAVEARWGAGSSQALFLIAPWLAVGAAAATAGRLARALGGSNLQVVAAVALASIASPLGSYAMLEFSEPIQAMALGVALTASFLAATSAGERPGLQLAAGFAGGVAVLAKSSLIVVAPMTLVPLVDPASLRVSARRLAFAALGSALPLGAWAAFEVVRFGRLFGGYPDERFTHPWFDGAWRLVVGANRGVLLFSPAVLLAIWYARRLKGRWWSDPAGRAWIAAFLVLVTQITVAAGFWAWHGMEGWGPRLIVSAIPLAAPFAALAVTSAPLLVLVVVFCVAINAPPLLQHPTPVATYVMNLTWPAVPEVEAARFPFYATASSAAGKTTVIPFEVTERTAAVNSWRLYLWFWRVSHLEGPPLAQALHDPPWRTTHAELVPASAWPPEAARLVAPPPRAGFLGRSLTGTGGPYATVYLDALLDQVVRANQLGQIDRALKLSEHRLALAIDGEAAAWRLETLRRAGRPEEAERVLHSFSENVRTHPLINAALSLFDRDFGEDARARALLGSVVSSFPGSAAQDALVAPLATWPATLDALTSDRRRDAAVARRR